MASSRDVGVSTPTDGFEPFTVIASVTKLLDLVTTGNDAIEPRAPALGTLSDDVDTDLVDVTIMIVLPEVLGGRVLVVT